MSYQVLARKWRPRAFSELMGQAHVVRALTHALDSDRVHHAFLFTGTRGVGKTTIARILARCLNCERGVSATPCGECGICREIDEGRFPDLIEVDAASRARVDETRELMDNVQYAPSRGRYKVYLIDEVHMFSGHSFNALLKTLEEPPPHVKFLLATTDPQKLPVTVLSRCLQFNLKRLPRDQIAAQLQRILEAEHIESEPPAVNAIAAAADGSMRDALSLMDQAIAFGGGRLLAEDTRAMLGTVERDHVRHLLEALAGGAGGPVLEAVARLDEQAPDYDDALAGLLSALQRIAVMQAVPETAPGPDGDEEDLALADLAGRLPPEDVQLYYQIGLLGRRDIAFAPDPRAGFEMILLRMLAFRPAVPGQAPAAGGGGASRGAPTPGATAAPAPQGSPAASRSVPRRAAAATDGEDASLPASPRPASRPASPSASPISSPGAPASTAQSSPSTPPAASPARPQPFDGAARPDLAPESWDAVVATLGLAGLPHQLAAHCALQAVEGSRVRLRLSPGHEPLMASGPRDKLEAALRAIYGEGLSLHIEVAEPDGDTPAAREARAREQRRAEAVGAIESDPQVRALCDTFDTRVDPGNVRPLDDATRGQSPISRGNR